MTQQSVSPTRLPRLWLWPARLAWFLILILASWKLILGTPLIYAEKLTICTGTAQECADGISLTTDGVNAIQAAGLSLEGYAESALAFRVFGTAIWFGIGILIFVLRSDDWMALVASAMMLLFTSGQASDPIARAYPSLGWLAQSGFNLQLVLLFLFVGLFPNGRFAPRWMRWYWIALVFFALGGENIIASVPAIQWAADWAWGPVWVSFLILGPYSQIYRYRKTSNPDERKQTRWVVFGFGAMAGFLLIGVAMQLIGVLPDFVMQDFYFGLAALALPISIGISILRYRLWDVDIVLRRTLIYGALSLTLGLVFFGGVTLLQQVFGAVTGIDESPAAIVISTLGIAALFAPLRRRIQHDIDRRFFRKKYDAEQTLAAFSATARDEVELENLAEALLAVTQETMQPSQISLWLKPAVDRREETKL